jgi:ketosteroid isomerase-like protein
MAHELARISFQLQGPLQPGRNRKYHGERSFNNEETFMTIASDLLQQHIQTLVDDNARWQTLIADDIIWELAYASSIGHPAKLSGRKEAVRHATWFVGAVVNFRFFDLKIYTLTDVQSAVAEVKAEGLINSTGRMYQQDYVVFLRAAGGKITFLREYFDPVRAARALNTPIVELES